MKQKVCILLLISWIPFFLHGKDAVDWTVDVTKYPQVRIVLSTDSTDASLCKVTENGKELDCSLKPYDGKRMVFFLFESSEVTHRKPARLIDQIVEGITYVSSDAYPNTRCAYGYYNRSSKDNKALHLISDSFASADSIPLNVIRGIASQTRPASKWTDMLKATYECIDWMGSNSDSYVSKQLIVIGTGKSLSESPIKHKECIDRAKQMGVQIQTIGLPSDDRYAFDNFSLLVQKDTTRFVRAMNSDEVKAAIGNYLSKSTVNGVVEYKSNYPADGKMHTAVVTVGTRTIKVNFKAPTNESFLGKYVYIVGVVVVCIVLVVLLVSRRKKKKRIQLKDAETNTPITSITHAETTTDTTLQTDNKSQQHTRGRTQITVRPTSLTIRNGGQTETIGIIEGISSFGRNPDNNIIIQNDTVSGNHFTLEFNGIDCIITNLSKSNGTLVNGIKQHKTVVYSGDVLKIGEVSIYLN